MCRVPKVISVCGVVLLTFVVVFSDAEDRNHKKRQIFREQVLPHAGGRVPAAAFESDRLFLNRLQKEGIAVPDGVVLEQRNPQVYPFHNKIPRTVFRIAVSSDGRFTAKEGRFLYDEVPTIETTYLYPQIHSQQVTLKPSIPVYPVYRQLQIYNDQINQMKLQPKKKGQLLSTAIVPNKSPVKPLKTSSYQNFNLLSLQANNVASFQPSTSATTAAAGTIARKENAYDTESFQNNFAAEDRHYLPSFQPTNEFNNFDVLFNNFDFYNAYPHTHVHYNQKEQSFDGATEYSASPAQLL